MTAREITNEDLDEGAAYYETGDAHHIWNHTDNWDLRIWMDNQGWHVEETVWAWSPMKGFNCYFRRAAYFKWHE